MREAVGELVIPGALEPSQEEADQVLADALRHGHEGVVVKSLDSAVGRPDVVSGTTILGDGKVVCILDAVRILEQRVA